MLYHPSPCSSMVRVFHWSSEGCRFYTYVIFALPVPSHVLLLNRSNYAIMAEIIVRPSTPKTSSKITERFQKKYMNTSLPSGLATLPICDNSRTGTSIKVLVQRILSCTVRQVLHKQCTRWWVLFPPWSTLKTPATTPPPPPPTPTPGVS